MTKLCVIGKTKNQKFKTSSFDTLANKTELATAEAKLP